MIKKYFILFSIAVSLLFSGQNTYARNIQDITDWYIKDFQTNIVVNTDSSLLVTENITADCGNLPDKHGIFRVLPTQINTDSGVYKTPISLVSITDFNGHSLHYETIWDLPNHTITWKIGDPNITVTGVNDYRIVYSVKNAVRFGNKNFDELYWNVLGDFWDIGTDNFSAKISFPAEVTSQNAVVDYYDGAFGSKDKSLATYSWGADGTLNFISTSPFTPKEGLTVSVTFPKNIFTPYTSTFMEQYGIYFWDLAFLIPIGAFIFAFLKWRKYGKDLKMKSPIPPEFGIPDLPAQAGNITPIQMGIVLNNGTWSDKMMTAAIVNLAVKKYIIIEQTESKVLFFTNKDIVLKKVAPATDFNNLTYVEKLLVDKLFSVNDTVKLSDLKNDFYKDLPAIKKAATDDAAKNGWIEPKGQKYQIGFIVAGVALIWFSFWMFFISWQLVLALFICGLIFIIFSAIMPKRTQAGLDLLFKIKGFELYMKQAENYRQQFYEKENIFDKFLPYAIVFGIAELWAKKMQLIYGEDYFKTYHPLWLAGTLPTNFSVSSFTSQLNSISSSISSSTGSSSGAGGGGSSGGGGGGGGGGGW